MIAVTFWAGLACYVAAKYKPVKTPLEGRWVSVRIEKGGERIRDSIEHTFAGDRMTILYHGQRSDYTFELDAKQNPHTIDVFAEVDGQRDVALLGIYSLKGGDLRIQFACPEDCIDDIYWRPKEFSHGDLDGATYWLRRTKEDIR